LGRLDAAAHTPAGALGRHVVVPSAQRSWLRGTRGAVRSGTPGDCSQLPAPCSPSGVCRRWFYRTRPRPRAVVSLRRDSAGRAGIRRLRRPRSEGGDARTAGRPGRGGLLIYATCSLEPEEDSEIVNEFLARHPAFARARPGAVPAELLTAEGDFQTLPQHHAVDGAYAARLVRTL